jgi:flagella basal body P-ring formation protein FlgA
MIMLSAYLRILCLGLGLISLLPMSSALANTKQDPRQIEAAVAAFLHAETAGLPGRAEITVGTIDPRTSLPQCAALEPTLPAGSRPWGNTTVIVRCMAPSAWTAYVRANVKVVANYVVSARPLKQGQALVAGDLTSLSGDLTQLPAGIVTDPDQAVGRTLIANLPFGSPLRQDMLRAQAVVIQNQTVKLVSSGPGFSITAEGRALNNAVDGQPIQVRSASGTVVSGIARMGGIVEVRY